MLSIIISATDEIQNHFFWETLNRIGILEDVECLIPMDKLKYSKTYERIQREFGWVKIIETQANSRASRLNIGVQQAKGPHILYQHPRSTLEPDAYVFLQKQVSEIAWGAFEHQFNFSHPILAFTSWYSNNVRFKMSKIAYLDHCIFINKDFFEISDILLPNVDIFEDTILSQQLAAKHAPQLLPYTCVTSAIRFSKNGIYRQSLLNQLLKIGHKLGLSDQLMNQIYEKGLSLNSDYRK